MEPNERWPKFASLFANMMFGSWYLLIGGLLATHLPLIMVVLALLVGNIIASLLFFAVGLIGFSQRTSTYEIAKSAFGDYGSRFLITILLVLARIGWVAVRAELGGVALSKLLGVSPIIGMVIFVTLLVLATTGSFKNLSRFGLLALLGTVLLSVVGLDAVFRHWSIQGVFSYIPNQPISFWEAINIILISKISFGTIVPDFFQKARSKADVFWGSVVGFLPTGLIAGTIGATLTIVAGTYNLVTILDNLNLPLLAYLFLAISSFAPATIYPTGIGFASIVGKQDDWIKKFGVVLAGLVGLSLAYFGIVGRLGTFLNFLGISFTPIIGVLLVDHYGIRHKQKASRINVAGLVSWVVGATISYLTSSIVPFGTASLNGLAASGVMYYLLKS